MTILRKINEMVEDRESNDFNRQLSALIDEVAMNKGLPYETVLKQALDTLEERKNKVVID